MVQEPNREHAIVFAIDRDFPADKNDAAIMAAIRADDGDWLVVGISEAFTWEELCFSYPRIAANNFTMHCLHECKKKG